MRPRRPPGRLGGIAALAKRTFQRIQGTFCTEDCPLGEGKKRTLTSFVSAEGLVRTAVREVVGGLLAHENSPSAATGDTGPAQQASA